MPRHLNLHGMLSPFSVNTHGIEAPPATSHPVYLRASGGQSTDGHIPADITGQTRWVWENLKTVLATANMGLEDLVHVNSYLTQRADLDTFLAVRKGYMLLGRPTATLVLVSGLVPPDWRMENKGYAVKCD